MDMPEQLVLPRHGAVTRLTPQCTGPHQSAAIYNSAVSRKQLPIHSVTPSVSNIHPQCHDLTLCLTCDVSV